MADVHPLHSPLPQEEPYATAQPADLAVGEQFLDGAIRTQKRKSRPPMCLCYGYLMAEDPSPDAASEKQVLDVEEPVLCGAEMKEVEVEVIDEDENGDRAFEIYFSHDNQNYLVHLAFAPEERSDDKDSPQEDGEGCDCYSDDDEEESCEEDESDDEDETCEGEEKNDDDGDLTGKRDFELYFPQGDLYYVVRLVFEDEVLRSLEEGDESLFSVLQRVVGISNYGDDGEEDDEDEVPAIEPKPAEPEISGNGIEYLERGKGSENDIERQSNLMIHSPLAQPAPLST